MSLLQPHDRQDGCDPVPFRPLIVVGASVRAAVQSASLAQFTPFGVDAFGDLDTQQFSAQWTRLDTHIDACSLLNSHPIAPIVATGGIESLIPWLEPLRKKFPVLIPSANTLQTLRDPEFLNTAATETGWHFPPWQWHRPTDGGKWFKKDCASAGGCEVVEWNTNHKIIGSNYFQKKAHGTAWGANFLATGKQLLLVGVSRSLRHAIGPRKYLYAGSIGPIVVSENQLQQLLKIGDWIRRNSDIRGLFGIDLLFRSANSPLTLLEINPRYTASMELWERASGCSLIEAHVASFQSTSTNPQLFRNIAQASPNPISGEYCGPYWIKRILWARNNVRWHRATVLETLGRWKIARCNTIAARASFSLCDYPADGTVIPVGSPIASWIFGPIHPSDPIPWKMASLHRQLSALEKVVNRRVAQA